MASCADPSLTRDDVDQDKPFVFILGERKKIKVKVFEYDDNGNIVQPTTIVVSNEVVDIYNCEDFTTVLLSDVPTQTDILDGNMNKIGILLTYVVDSANVALNAVGEYAIVFTYDIDGVETRKAMVFFNIVDMSCPLNNC